MLCHVRSLRERCCPSHSPDLRPWIAEVQRPTWRAFGARRSCALGKFAGKSRGLFSSVFSCASSAEEPFSLGRGLTIRFRISSWASPFLAVGQVLKRQRRPFRIALAAAAIRLETPSSHASGRGPTHHRSGTRQRGSTRSRSARRTPLPQGTVEYVRRSSSRCTIDQTPEGRKSFDTECRNALRNDELNSRYSAKTSQPRYMRLSTASVTKAVACAASANV